MTNITEQELKLFENCKSETEWNNTCDQIKKPETVNIPPDWYDKVMISGILTRIMKN